MTVSYPTGQMQVFTKSDQFLVFVCIALVILLRPTLGV